MKICRRIAAMVTLYPALTLLLTSCSPTPPAPPLQEWLNGRLVNASGTAYRPAHPVETEYTLLYFSAHWCPPCRAFTPQLVRFHQANGGGVYFKTILVSSDRTPDAMLDYMKETAMPWPAVRFQSPAARHLQNTYSGRGIPRLVLLNPAGDILADSFDGKKYLGPQSVLNHLQRQLAQRPADPAGLAEAAGKALPPTAHLAERFSVQGIAKGSGHNVAIINGTTVSSGDELGDGIRVEAITDTHVEISLHHNRYRLTP